MINKHQYLLEPIPVIEQKWDENITPLVSVSCITFNHVNFIRDAIDGFLMQKTSFPVEIIIHDDASTDGTADIIKEYVEKYPDLLVVILQTENQWSKGIKPSATYAFPRARGNYIALCEGDDYWTDPYKLQKQVDFLGMNNNYSMCFHKCKIIDFDNNELDSLTFNHLEGKDYTGEEILEKWSIPTASVMFRAEYLNQIIKRAKTPGYLYGDTPMFLTLMENGKSRCLVDNMSVYRIHADGMSRSTKWLDKIALYKHYKTLKGDFNGKYSKIMAKNISEYAYGLGAFLLKSGHFVYGIKFLIVSFYYDKTTIIKQLLKKLYNVGKKNRSLTT